VVTVMLRQGCAQGRVRPFDPYRDLKQVAALIAIAFGDRLGPDGQIALAEMRRVARWSPLLWWFYWPEVIKTGIASGFVWVEQGRVMGNVSLRRSLGRGGFFIGNVAVHPEWQGRGIASALMEAALDAIAAQGAHWVGLEVQADNHVARHLYDHRGFRAVGRTCHMLRPAGLPWAETPSPYPLLRRGRGTDRAAVVQLVHATIPESQRQMLELRKEDYSPGWEHALACWLEGRHEAWWMRDEGGEVCGAVRALRERGRRPDRLEVLVKPEFRSRLEAVLVQQGLSSLHGVPKRMVGTILPYPNDALVAALETAGFEKLRVLVQMRLDLSPRIAVKKRGWGGQ
jgi:GNAT superfamily N-acetyltransferase